MNWGRHRGRRTIAGARRSLSILQTVLRDPSRAIRCLHDDIGYCAALGIVWQRLVESFGIGVFGDDVPGVEQAWDEAEHAQTDVD